MMVTKGFSVGGKDIYLKIKKGGSMLVDRIRERELCGITV